jgi:hypothetical protein
VTGGVGAKSGVEDRPTPPSAWLDDSSRAIAMNKPLAIKSNKGIRFLEVTNLSFPALQLLLKSD